MTVKGIVIKAVGAIFLIAFLFFGFKGCIVTTWDSPKAPQIYSIQGEDGRIMGMVFLPKHETMIWHFDPANQSAEAVLTKMLGSYGTHYIWRLWHVEAPGIMGGYRLCPPGTEPVNMEITIVEKLTTGTGDSRFPERGYRTHQVLLFGKDVVNFQGMWLQREPDNPEMVTALLTRLGGSREK